MTYWYGLQRSVALFCVYCALFASIHSIPGNTMGIVRKVWIDFVSTYLDLCSVNTIVKYRMPIMFILASDNINTLLLLFMRNHDG